MIIENYIVIRVIIIAVGRNERDPKGVDLFILAFQRFGHVAFLDRGTPRFPQTYFCSVANNIARQKCPGRQVNF